MINGLITIVIPIYNVEKYIDRCIWSVVNQSYQHLEIILVDDGSPDRCPQICDEWAKKDSRIKVIHKKNAGLGMARNTGIENATGEYICFFDSDDYIAEDAIEKAYLQAENVCADVVIFGFNKVGRDGNIINRIIPHTSKKVYKGTDVQKLFLPDLIATNPDMNITTGLCMSAWASMFSLDLIQRIGWRFVSEREIISEDVYSLLVLYRDVNCVAVLFEATYFYCENENSLSHSFRKDRYEKICSFYQQCISLSREYEYSKEVENRLLWPYLAFTIVALKQIAAANIAGKEKSDAIKRIVDDSLLQNALKAVEGKTMSPARKLFFFLIRHHLYIVIWLLCELKNG